eukprot:TRINITY_DN24214_c0_g2_i3.p1 TRINITY_DN24214_c0_g2~~TRINITY_DN24214_c0_g2_i3.p1  ORF type:complete len:234 (-),score=-26.00 TRINITY_DN24214_c0_g2_i3:19-720(-)
MLKVTNTLSVACPAYSYQLILTQYVKQKFLSVLIFVIINYTNNRTILRFSCTSSLFTTTSPNNLPRKLQNYRKLQNLVLSSTTFTYKYIFLCMQIVFPEMTLLLGGTFNMIYHIYYYSISIQFTYHYSYGSLASTTPRTASNVRSAEISPTNVSVVFHIVSPSAYTHVSLNIYFYTIIIYNIFFTSLLTILPNRSFFTHIHQPQHALKVTNNYRKKTQNKNINNNNNQVSRAC